MLDSPLIENADEATAVIAALRTQVDAERRFPDSPFLSSGFDSWCEFERFLDRGFAPFLESLAVQYGDDYVLGASLEPPPHYYQEYYESSAVFRIPRHQVLSRYGEAISIAPNGDPPGALEPTSRVFCVGGSSGSWTIWGERWLSLAVVHTAASDMSWRKESDWFVSTDEAVSWFVGPNWRDGILPEGMREGLRQNFNSLDRPR